MVAIGRLPLPLWPCLHTLIHTSSYVLSDCGSSEGSDPKFEVQNQCAFGLP